MTDSPISQGHFVHQNTTATAHESLLGLFSLKGKTAIVTGAAAGIGYAVVQGFAEAGANIALWYNSSQKAVERAAEIQKKYGVKCTSLFFFFFALLFLVYLQGYKFA